MKKNAIVGQSGGPTAVINASLYGVIKECRSQECVDRVYGMIHGIEGFLSENCMDLNAGLNAEETELLKLTPGAYLGSCRYKLPDDLSSPVYGTLFEKFREKNIGYFFYIGGNDSMDTVSKLSRYAARHKHGLRLIGIPKTIDNDLVLTDHTPGYGSAAKYVAQTIGEIVLDSSVYQQKSVTIVELMGRHAGWITAASALARRKQGDNPLLIYLPEIPFDFERFARHVADAFQKSSTLVICISEGLSDKNGRFICEYEAAACLDTFGHKMLTGSGKMLQTFIRSRFGVKVRSIELNINQRCSGIMMSKTDMEESVLAGREGVKAAVNGESGQMISFIRSQAAPFWTKCRTVDVNAVCNQERLFPEGWVTGHGTDVSREYIDYALPLIQGEVIRPYESGRPIYLRRKLS